MEFQAKILSLEGEVTDKGSHLRHSRCYINSLNKRVIPIKIGKLPLPLCTCWVMQSYYGVPEE